MWRNWWAALSKHRDSRPQLSGGANLRLFFRSGKYEAGCRA